MQPNIFTAQRNSHMEIGKIYFWTATIHKWLQLLSDNKYKRIILDSFAYLNQSGCIDLFAFVIMPNHIHVICRTNKLNGKESPHGSFLKFTAHEFKKQLKNNPLILKNYSVSALNKKYEFWQRDPLAIHIYSPEVAYQKLDYIHNNPLAEHWQLANDPSGYRYSSAAFYERDLRVFPFLKDLREEI